MNFLVRILERIIIAVVSFWAIWFIITQIFDPLEDRLPISLAVGATYIIAAYIFVPRVIDFTVFILRRGRIPRFTRAADGLVADPVNIILVGKEEDLKKVFQAAGWHEADKLTLRSAGKMIQTFIRNRPYPTAPFSSLYLFGRRQDHGFQQPIGNSPRRRHHIRFWAANFDPTVDLTNFRYWLSHHEIDPEKPLMWLGAGTKDIGFGLTRLSYQISHATDKNVDEERDYVLSSLRAVGGIQAEKYYEASGFKIGKYISDGKIFTAELRSLEEWDEV